MEYIINDQGLRDLNNKFILKEVAILGLKNRAIGHWIVKAPHNFTELSIGIKRSNEYISNQFHSVRWHEGDIMAKVDIRVFTHGHDNWRYLETVMSDELVNVEEMYAPTFQELKKNKQHSNKKIVGGFIRQWIKRASTVSSHISTVLWCSQIVSQEKNLCDVHSVKVLFVTVQSSDIVQPRLQNILTNMLLSTTYAVNKSNSKRISLGLECHQGSFRPVVKLSTVTGSFKSITFNVASCKVFKNYFDLINTYFQDAYRFQSEYGRPTNIYMENHDLVFTTSYNTKSILIEERPVGTRLFPNLLLDEEDEDEVNSAFAESATCGSDATPIVGGFIRQWIKRASTVRSHISTVLWYSQIVSQEKNLCVVHSVKVLFAMVQSSDIVQPRSQNILTNMLLSTTYAVNKSNSKRISLGLECHQGISCPVVKLSTATGSFKSIKFDVASWKVFENYFDLIKTYFQDAYRFQSEYRRPTKIYMENHDLMFTTSYNTKSILIEERPVFGGKLQGCRRKLFYENCDSSCADSLTPKEG
ncbi:hypothetical protein TSAR_013906 [Trichomalopsis sarcophagae]|uniref:Uncharacterized protein n=1 Tax=Trichomalopsis sarcophagae TaxID=543379 RepID=A0A232FKU7_9HYME|nr:hypothetical protein TSAR_013906 [Trichomalopsis sarcophagae]